MKKILLAIVVLVIVVVGWMFLKNKKVDVVVSPTLDSTSSPQATPLVSPESTVSPSPVASKNIITYTDEGYTPNLITIKKGETVVWKNESTDSMWTASAVHPTHRAYPGTDISACETQTLMPMFDACEKIVPGQSWSFTFNNVGTWGYHNHKEASHAGKVVVQ